MSQEPVRTGSDEAGPQQAGPQLVARSGRIKGVAVDRRVGQRFPSGIDAVINAAINRHAGRTTLLQQSSVREV